MTKQRTLAYRPEIDGLRAIAVLSVVLYHFGAPIQGGFTGVDVFFVISGFLIGGILWREHRATGRINIFAFYIRRFRRLAPAFFAMMFATMAIGWFILLPFEYREFAKSAIATTVYLSNVLFFWSAGYFDTISEEKPLLHTWSLAVEEQFYIVLPLLFYALAWARKSFIWTLVALWLGSLLACVFLTPSHPTATFFLFPFRAWELLSGVLLAIYFAERAPGPALPASISYLGMACLLAGFLLVPASAQFPGYFALLPVIGTVLLLLNGQASNAVNKALSSAVPVFFGKISYSLYLWHWPILVMALYLRGDESSTVEVMLWLIASCAIATLSWRYVETPVRQSPKISGKVVFGGTVLLSALSLGAAAGIFKQDGLVTRFSDTAQVHINATADFLQDWSRCYIADSGGFEGLELCPIGPEGEPRVLIWGDSHVRALREGLNLASQEANVPGLIIWRAGCPPFFGIEKDETAATPSQNAACGLANRQIESAVSGLDVLENVLLVGRWTYYWTGTGVGLDDHNIIHVSSPAHPGISQSDVLTSAAEASIDQLSAKGLDVYVMQQPPEISGYDSRIAARALALKEVPFANTSNLSDQISRQSVAERHVAHTKVWRKLDAQGKITRIEVWDRLCDTAECFALHDDVGQYFDNNHLTNQASLRIRSVFYPFFNGMNK